MMISLIVIDPYEKWKEKIPAGLDSEKLTVYIALRHGLTPTGPGKGKRRRAEDGTETGGIHLETTDAYETVQWRVPAVLRLP